MKLLEYKRKNTKDDINTQTNSKITIPEMLTLSSDDQDIVNKWVFSINYFISN